MKVQFRQYRLAMLQISGFDNAIDFHGRNIRRRERALVGDLPDGRARRRNRLGEPREPSGPVRNHRPESSQSPFGDHGVFDDSTENAGIDIPAAN